MKTVMVACFKGGMGKTTTVRDLAAIWTAQHDRRVAIWDGDPQGSLTRAFRNETVSAPWRAEPQLVGIDEMRENALLFPGGWDLALTRDEALVQQHFRRPDWEDRLRDAAFDIAILDTPPGGVAHVLAAADLADLLLIPVDTSPTGLEGLAETLEFINLIQPPIPTRVLLTRARKGQLITRRITHFLDRECPGMRIPVMIPEDVAVIASTEPKVRMPLAFHAPQARATLAYQWVARYLLEVLDGLTPIQVARTAASPVIGGIL